MNTLKAQNQTRTLLVGGASAMSKAAARLLREEGCAVVLLTAGKTRGRPPSDESFVSIGVERRANLTA